MERYFYRVDKISHRPEAEDKITVVQEVREDDLQLARILASKSYTQAVQDLRGKYSPSALAPIIPGKVPGIIISYFLSTMKKRKYMW